MRLRANPRVAVEYAEPHAHLIWVGRVSGHHARPAPRAEELGPTVARLPRRQQLLTLHDPERPGLRPGLHRRRRPRPPLAAGAMAVPRAGQRRVDLEAHTATVAAAGEGEVGHGADAAGGSRTPTELPPR